MAHVSNLPCDGEGICMRCNSKPPQEETLTCKTCATPWHLACLSSPPESLSSALEWDCPDCSQTGGEGAGDAPPPFPVGRAAESSQLVAAIREIERDESLTEQEKARKRQRLLSKGKGKVEDEDSSDLDEAEKKKGKGGDNNDVLDLLDENFNCSFCMKLPERPVTTPCGHNFCLKCFEKWTGQGKRSCVKCRSPIPPKMATQPRINSSLVVAIRLAKMSKNPTSDTHGKVYHFLHNQQRPDKAFTTERAKKAGKANACSGKIFVTVPPDHFGPILAENDPVRNQGVLVGECWEDRMECRQWGAHLPHIAGIAGQSEYGSQSVALSGGYVDDEDHGEWFLYTGSGGRDLSGNKRTNKEQSSDQKFEKLNEALRLSCKKGYPVRVVRSHKEKRSSYAPEKGVRYDGVYRIEKCWRKVGVQGYKVCRYLFVRCDNEPAPWTSDEHGDHPRPLPVINELKTAIDVTERKETPAWDYDDESSTWKWKKSPPLSRRSVDTQNPEDRKRTRKATQHTKKMSVRDNLLKEFSCLICRKVLNHPVTTPCAHNFCKHCLVGAFSGQSFVRERTCAGRRTLRSQKNIMKCPVCPADISDFLQNPQVNRELMGAIESLQKKPEEENVEALGEAAEGENVEALGEAEFGDSDEQSGSLCENSEPEMQDDTRAVQNPSEQKSKRMYKRRKVNEDALISKTDSIEKMENSSEEQKFENLTGDNDDEEVDNSVPKPVNNPNTEGGEIIKVSDEVANEAKDSPSSPHHVGSEVDDME